MKTIGILAQKGGAGKTTLTLHWAVEANAYGSSVAVIDTDPQGSAAKWGQRRLTNTPMVLQVSPEELPGALDACRSNQLEYVLVDTMPRVERWPSVETARLSDLVVIPCGPTIVDIEAIEATVDITARTGTQAVIVLNQGVAGSSVNDKAIVVLSREYGLPVCPVTIMRRVALSHAFNDGRAVRELEPTSKAATEITNSWKWIVEQLEAVPNKIRTQKRKGAR